MQFPAVCATAIGAGAHTLCSLAQIWLEGVQLLLRNLPVAIPIDETDLVSALEQALLQLDFDPEKRRVRAGASRSAACALRRGTDGHQRAGRFRSRVFRIRIPCSVVAGQDFGKALGMLLRPQLQQLPLAVIDELICPRGTIS
ncbi:ethanolamine ammonia-lyase reactivating factor EutA [Escherichia coli]